MKKILLTGLCSLVLVAIVADVTYAQRGGRGGFRTRAAEILCDALLLNAEKSEQVISTYEEISGQLFEKMRGENTDWQSMSREERRERFEQFQNNMAIALKKELKDILSEKELKDIEPILSLRFRTPVPELRGLRLIELKEEQRAALKPLALQLTEAIIPAFPRREGVSEEAQKKFDDVKSALVSKAEEVLNDEQKQAWRSKSEEVQKEIEAIQARRRERRQQ